MKIQVGQKTEKIESIAAIKENLKSAGIAQANT